MGHDLPRTTHHPHDHCALWAGPRPATLQEVEGG